MSPPILLSLCTPASLCRGIPAHPVSVDAPHPSRHRSKVTSPRKPLCSSLSSTSVLPSSVVQSRSSNHAGKYQLRPGLQSTVSPPSGALLCQLQGLGREFLCQVLLNPGRTVLSGQDPECPCSLPSHCDNDMSLYISSTPKRVPGHPLLRAPGVKLNKMFLS